MTLLGATNTTKYRPFKDVRRVHWGVVIASHMLLSARPPSGGTGLSAVREWVELQVTTLGGSWLRRELGLSSVASQVLVLQRRGKLSW